MRNDPTRVYRRLLALAPTDLRARHGDEMAAVFADAIARARVRGRRAVAAVWLRAALDLAAARVRSMARRSRTHSHEPRSTSMLGTDLRYTFRWLRRQKTSTALVVVMLTLGIAANIVVFSLIDGLFLRPFPFPDQDRLVYVNVAAPKWNLDVVGINYPDFAKWQEQVRAFEAIGIWDEASFNLSAPGAPAERIDGAEVTSGFAAALGVQPILGRMFTADEDRPNGPPVVLIGERVWRERFAGSLDVLGQTLRLNNVARTIIGVLPARAEFPGRIKLWVPLAGDPAQSYRSYGYAGAIGRLKPGVTAEAAQEDLRRAHEQVWATSDPDKATWPFVRPLRYEFSNAFRTRAQSLLIATAILMLVACANVASVMLARALVRRREMGIRLAVGASRPRLARQLFLENMVLAIVGGALGLLLGLTATNALVTTAGDQVPAWASFTLDWRMALFTALLTIATTLLFGWAPAMHALSGNVRGAMHDASTGTTRGPGGRRTLSILVGAEFALAAILLICGGLLVRAYGRVQAVDPGFRVEDVTTFRLSLPSSTYDDRPGDAPGQRARVFWDRLTERLRAVPGVEDVGLISCAPLGCHWGNFYEVEGRAPLKSGEPTPVTLYRPASPGYFTAMGIRLRHGRFLTDSDGRGDARAAVVNETFVRTFLPGVDNAVGRRIRPESSRNPQPWITIVGVVEDVKHYGLERPMRPGLYLPLAQSAAWTMTVVLHTKADAIGSARAVVRELDPDLAMYQVQSMTDALRRSMSDRRTYSWLVAVFALTAALLALGGTYGVTTYLISQRTREIGIRVALGARIADIARTVLGSSLTVVALGGAIGAGGAVVLARLLDDLLFGVAPHDPIVLGVTLTALLVFAAIVNALPTRRAARVDPARTLRAD
ncbi:MAG TPA: ABC transporter permease [Vicinamibacterales bacterium]|nr:ABC transporter permease [Vicinamibacterales bacterium]